MGALLQVIKLTEYEAENSQTSNMIFRVHRWLHYSNSSDFYVMWCFGTGTTQLTQSQSISRQLVSHLTATDLLKVTDFLCQEPYLNTEIKGKTTCKRSGQKSDVHQCTQLITTNQMHSMKYIRILKMCLLHVSVPVCHLQEAHYARIKTNCP